MCNTDIKDRMRASGVYQWQIAEYLGISEATMCRKMRSELKPEFREQVNQAIQALGSPPGYAKIKAGRSGIVVNK